MNIDNNEHSFCNDLEALVEKARDHEVRIRVLENDDLFFKDQIKEIKIEIEDVKNNVEIYQQLIDQKLTGIFERLVEHITNDATNLRKIFVSSILEFFAIFGSLLFILLEITKK